MNGNYKDTLITINKEIEKKQKMLQQAIKLSIPVVNLEINSTALKQLESLQKQMKKNLAPIECCQNLASSYLEMSNLTKIDNLSKIDFTSNLQNQLEGIVNPLTNILSEKISNMYISNSFSNQCLKSISDTINSTADFSSITRTLNNNIKMINSIFDNLHDENSEEINEEEANEILSKTQNIEFNIPFPEDTSIAEMEATVNGEEYIEPDLDYKKFDILLKTTSFIKDPVKAVENLNKALILANHFLDYSLKIQIYTLLKDQIISLIANKLLLAAIPLIKILLDIFLKDNETYKRFIELKNSIKEAKK